MGLTVREAYRILELPEGSSPDEIRSSYKKLALKWHPDKHSHTEGQEEATKRFQQVSAAYKRLTNEDSDDDEVYMSTADMFDLFAHIFHANVGCYCHCSKHPHYMYDSEESLYSDESDDDYLFEQHYRSRYTRRSDDIYAKPHNLSEAEAFKNAQELIEEEEKEKKKAEKKRAKKKRSKQRKKQKEKEKKEPEEKENSQINSNPAPREEQVSTKVNEAQKDKNQPTKQDTMNKSKTNSSHPQKDIKIQANVNYKTAVNGSALKTQNLQTPTNQPLSKKDHKISNGVTSKKSKNDDSLSTEEEDEEDTEWDMSSAFFARGASKSSTLQTTNSKPSVKNNIPVTNTVNPQGNSTPIMNGKQEPQKKVSDPQPQVEIDPVVLKSRQIAVQGNEMANQNNYIKAVELFTQAISLDSRDFRFFGNRSYCYDRLTQYDKALQDADTAIALAPDWPKGYFRRGRALAGLKLYVDAETSFAQVLKLDKHCDDAMFELDRVRVAQLVEMGFPPMQSQIAIERFGTVQSSLDAILAGRVKVPDVCEEVYRSDEGEDEEDIVAQSEATRIGDSTSFKNFTTKKATENTQNGAVQCSSLWIGNVNPEEVSERHIRQIFTRFGTINSVRMLPNRYCAFVNYYKPESAAQALRTVQGYRIGGNELLLRYPNNSIAGNLMGSSNSSIDKDPEPIQQNGYKMSGPVNGDECYFWRTSGCYFGDKCRYRHLPESRAADLGKVREKYGGKLRPKTPGQGTDDTL